MLKKVSSVKGEGLSLSDCDDDCEEKEMSDDDDDRNHKHRRREEQSQSMERDRFDEVVTRPNRKRNKPFRGIDSQSSEPWKRKHSLGVFGRGPNMGNQSFLGAGRGRGIHHDPRFGSQNMFAGRGLPVIPNSLGSSWSPYGLIPGVLNGGMDSLHPLGLQGALRPSMSPSQNMGIMRQRCRDFEERGFCLRGDMCPMEHGVNRIVIDDVQSLSQFNLPVSLPNGNLGSSSAIPSVGTSSSTMMNSNSLHNKNGKAGLVDGGVSNRVSAVSASADGSDFYDPDQPLWVNDGPGTSTELQGLNPSKFDETEFCDTRIEHDKNKATDVGSQGTSKVWGRVGSKNKSEMKGRFDSTIRSSHSDPNKSKQGQGMLADFEHNNPEGRINSQYVDTSLKKPTHKAFRTLFVNCIPKKDNNIEALRLHFQKFGEIIDIYIPHTGDRAFVQFSKREDAERALKAPDAVMGNRFVKLLWANRDRISEDFPNGANSAALTPRAVTALKPNVHSASNSSAIRADNPKPFVPNISKGTAPSQKKPGNLALLEEFRKRQESFAQKRDALQRELAKMEKKAAGSKGEVASEQVAKRQKVGTGADSAKAEAPNSNDSGTKFASPQAEVVDQKKPVDQSTSKQLTTVESADEKKPVDQSTSKQLTTVESADEKKPVDQSTSKQLTTVEETDQKKPVDRSTSKQLKSVELPEVTNLKPSIQPLASPGAPFGSNRYKLDNRPTALKILPPLPAGLGNIDVLKKHFSAFGELCSVRLEDGNCSDSASSNNRSALVCFSHRRSAEKAFINGKCWQSNTLQFIWVASSNSSIGNGNKEKPNSLSEVSTTVSAESGNFANIFSNSECVEKGEDLRSSSSSVSGNL